MQDQASPDEIDLRRIAAAIWNGRWIVLGSTVACSLAAILAALLMTPIYRAEAVVQVRNDSKAGGGLAAVAAQLGGLADFAGLGTTDSDRASTLATLKSRVLIQAFLLDKGVLPVLFEDEWDPATKSWTVGDPKDIPTPWHGHKMFVEEILRISDDKKTGLVTVAVEWTDAEVAAAWVTELIARTNAYLREKAIQESEKNLAYLQHQLRQLGQVELQQSAYALVESELKKLMLAKGNEEYAIKTIDPAQPPKRRYKPNRALIAIGGLIFGGIAGLLILFLQSQLGPHREA